MFSLPTDFRWIPPWEPIEVESAVLTGRQLQADFKALQRGNTANSETVANSLSEELHREIPAHHRLANCAVQAIGRCHEDADAILFATNDDAAPLAVVHLTWRVETDPSWPYTVIYHSLDDWIAQMKRENLGVRWADLSDIEE